MTFIPPTPKHAADRRKRSFVVTGIAAAALVCGITAAHEAHWRLTTSPCVVASVTDGDTVKAYIDGLLQACRLEGIDAPELDQPFGPESKQALERLVVGKANIRAGVGKRDLYGRMMTTLYAGERNVNVTLVERGYAWHYVAYARKRDDLKRAQQVAQGCERGLWDGKPVAPWDWRKLSSTERAGQ